MKISIPWEENKHLLEPILSKVKEDFVAAVKSGKRNELFSRIFLSKSDMERLNILNSTDPKGLKEMYNFQLDVELEAVEAKDFEILKSTAYLIPHQCKKTGLTKVGGGVNQYFRTDPGMLIVYFFHEPTYRS